MMHGERCFCLLMRMGCVLVVTWDPVSFLCGGKADDDQKTQHCGRCFGCSCVDIGDKSMAQLVYFPSSSQLIPMY